MGARREAAFVCTLGSIYVHTWQLQPVSSMNFAALKFRCWRPLVLMRKTRRLQGDLWHFYSGRKTEAVLQGLRTNAQSGNLQVLFFPCVAWGKLLENLRTWEGFLMEMVEKLTRSKAGLYLGWQTGEFVSNTLPQVIVRVSRELSPGQHHTGTMANGILGILGGVGPAGWASRQLGLLSLR